MATPGSLNDELINLLVRSRTTNGRPLSAEEAARSEAVYQAIRERLDAEPSPEYRAMSADFERHPARYQESLRRLLKDLASRDPAFAARLERLAHLVLTQNFYAPVGQLTTIDRAGTVVIAPPKGKTASGPAELPPSLADLRDRLMVYFNLEELRDLAFELGINPETIPANTLQAFARGLILVCWRDGKLEQLAGEATRLRPHGDWRFELSGLPAKPPEEYDDVPSARQTTIINTAGTVKNIRSIFSDVRQVVAVLAVVLGVAALASAIKWYSEQPRRMEGEFNIAVADIKMAADASEAFYGQILTQQIASILSAELETIDPGVQLSAVNMPLVNDEEGARRLAERVNADIVIYGEAEALPGADIRLTPHFYVNDTKHPTVYDVNGSDFLEKAIQITKESLDEEPPDTAQIADRAALMTDFTQALVYLAFDDPAAAGRKIESAVERVEHDEALAGLAGYEVIYLYASQIARLRGDPDAAETYALESLEMSEDTYARAYLALGNIFFDREDSQGRKTDLFQARQAYRAAMERSSLGDLPELKASNGLGNVALSTLLDNHSPFGTPCSAFEQANAAEGLSQYRKVIDAFEADQTADEPDQRLREMAGRAWASTGKIHHSCGERVAAIDAYRAALTLPLSATAKEEVIALLAVLESEES